MEHIQHRYFRFHGDVEVVCSDKDWSKMLDQGFNPDIFDFTIFINVDYNDTDLVVVPNLAACYYCGVTFIYDNSDGKKLEFPVPVRGWYFGSNIKIFHLGDWLLYVRVFEFKIQLNLHDTSELDLKLLVPIINERVFRPFYRSFYSTWPSIKLGSNDCLSPEDGIIKLINLREKVFALTKQGEVLASDLIDSEYGPLKPFLSNKRVEDIQSIGFTKRPGVDVKLLMSLIKGQIFLHPVDQIDHGHLIRVNYSFDTAVHSSVYEPREDLCLDFGFEVIKFRMFKDKLFILSHEHQLYLFDGFTLTGGRSNNTGWIIKAINVYTTNGQILGRRFMRTLPSHSVRIDVHERSEDERLLPRYIPETDIIKIKDFDISNEGLVEIIDFDERFHVNNYSDFTRPHSGGFSRKSIDDLGLTFNPLRSHAKSANKR